MQVRNRPAQLGVFLRPSPGKTLRVGTLVRDAEGRILFSIDDSYLALGPDRPLASLAWKGATEELSVQRLVSPRDKVSGSGLLPPFFQNMLPEGALRDLVEGAFGGGGAFDNFDVLATLGEDLPGAIVVRLESGEVAKPKKSLAEQASATGPLELPIRFSLAGVQLKFSMVKDRHALTLPFSGHSGEVILKTPSPTYKFLPEAEMTAMAMAEAAGVSTAKVWLVERDQVAGLPKEFLDHGPHCLAVQRFDRAPDDGRVQIEDLAQIYGAIGDAKYATGNDATIMSTAARFSTDPAGEGLEALRRVIVNVLLGNGDAHLKNWSFIYPQTGDIALSPAYDVVPTFLYGDDRMAMKIGGTKNPYNIGVERLERAAALMRLPEKAIRKCIRRTVEGALDTWPKILADSALPPPTRGMLLDRLPKLALTRDVAPHIIQGFVPHADDEPSSATSGP